MIETCGNWSHDIGIQFSPQKCHFLGTTPENRPHPIRLYGVDLPSAEVAPYLGLPFRQHGIDWNLLAKERSEKTRAVVSVLTPLGFNGMGWAPASSVLIYKLFIRPVLEYGVALHVPSGKCLQSYETAQNNALRSLLSVDRSSSAGAIRKLLQVESM